MTPKRRSMNELQIFNSEEFGEIRTVTIDNEPWFVGKDVAEALNYNEPHKAVQRHVEEDDRMKHPITDSSGRVQDTWLISESGLYALIFGSKLESAKRFKRWVTSEVLPTIRKTGQYQMPNMSAELKAIIMHDEKIIKIENRMDKLEFDIPLYGSEADEISGHVKRKGVSVLGGKKTEAYKDSNIRSKVYRDIYDQIKREFGIYSDDGKPKSYKALKRKYIYEAHECIDAYEVPIYLKEMIDNANAQISLNEIA